MVRAEELLKAGKLEEALKKLQDEVRSQPNEAKHRIFLFKLLCINGDFERAVQQAELAKDLDAAHMLVVQVWRQLVICERLRAEVFEGKRSPLIFGEPEQWIAWLVQACALNGQGKHEEAAALRAQAFEEAPTTSGTIEIGTNAAGQGSAGKHEFGAIFDADTRLGPVLEVMVEGKYFWVPFHRIKSIAIEPPTDIGDKVWLEASFVWSTGGAGIGFIPVRYPGSEKSPDPMIRLASRTEFHEPIADTIFGMGARMIGTDAGEFTLLDIRNVTLNIKEG